MRKNDGLDFFGNDYFRCRREYTRRRKRMDRFLLGIRDPEERFSTVPLDMISEDSGVLTECINGCGSFLDGLVREFAYDSRLLHPPDDIRFERWINNCS